MSLTSAQLAVLQDRYEAGDYVGYYFHLNSFGEPYGALAGDVASATGISGQVARAFARSVGEELGVTLSDENWSAPAPRRFRHGASSRTCSRRGWPMS